MVYSHWKFGEEMQQTRKKMQPTTEKKQQIEIYTNTHIKSNWVMGYELNEDIVSLTDKSESRISCHPSAQSGRNVKNIHLQEKKMSSCSHLEYCWSIYKLLLLHLNSRIFNLKTRE